MEGARAAYQKDVEMYHSIRNQFINRSCPGCEGSNYQHLCQKDGFVFVRCDACWTVFMNPGPSSSAVERLYQTSHNYEYWGKEVYPASVESRFTKLTVPRAEYVIDALDDLSASRKVKLLEVGAGTGEIVKYIKKLNQAFETFAVEPNPSMWKYFQDSGVTLLKTSLEQLDNSDADFDAIFAFEVIEHLLEPKHLFEKAFELLKPGGKLIFSTPNAQSLEVLSLREASITLDIEHISILSPLAIHSLAKQYGFSVRQIETPGKLDLELMKSKYRKSFLKLILKGDASENRIQDFISKFGLSSHMKLILEKTNTKR
jgi:2-polyprenyl-3-methyl-5-hydroxy-6-metoxy-1,4-benzoquinol methylase